MKNEDGCNLERSWNIGVHLDDCKKLQKVGEIANFETSHTKSGMYSCSTKTREVLAKSEKNGNLRTQFRHFFPWQNSEKYSKFRNFFQRFKIVNKFGQVPKYLEKYWERFGTILVRPKKGGEKVLT